MNAQPKFHGRPTAAELVTATREFLHDLLPEVPPGHAFHLRVAINALSIVERELTDAAPGVSASRRLGWADDAELAAAIRADAVPPWKYAGLAVALADDIRERLRVASPRFLAGYEPDGFEGDI